MGEARVDEVTRLAAATSSKDPDVGLATAAARMVVGRLADQGVLPRPDRSDAAALRGDPRPNRRAKRRWAYLGLPGPGANSVGRVVEGRGLCLEQLRGAVLAEPHAAT
jgi:hypothetical protein